jgi:hypothetical protein
VRRQGQLLRAPAGGARPRRGRELGVNVRVLADGEEEVGGHSVIHHLAASTATSPRRHLRRRRWCTPSSPPFTTGLRGLVGAQVRVPRGARELHSGIYGGVAANPSTRCIGILAALVDLPEAFSEGIAPVTERERAAAGRRSCPGAEELERGGVTPSDSGRCGGVLRPHVGAAVASRALIAIRRSDPAQDVDPDGGPGVALDPARARPGRRGALPRPRADCCATRARPPPSSSSRCGRRASPVMDPAEPTLQAAFAAVERATGVRPLAVRSGGSIVSAAAFTARGIPTLLDRLRRRRGQHPTATSGSRCRASVGAPLRTRDSPRPGALLRRLTNFGG